MKSQSPAGGRILNNGSVSDHAPRPNAAPYAAAKHAITRLTKSIALDQHVADTVLHFAQLHLEVNIPFLTITANQMPHAGRG
jgi:NAD(P)-dependent dehydrogenase (short-subunit alcohol dehydrogenase family)